MNLTSTLTLVAALALAAATPVRSAGTAGMDGMHGMETKDKPSSKAAPSTVHRANALVKSVDVAQGKVTLAHDPVKSLGWPAMTMGFAVKDKSLFDKLAVGKKVHVEFKKEKAAYVVTAVE